MVNLVLDVKTFGPSERKRRNSKAEIALSLDSKVTKASAIIACNAILMFVVEVIIEILILLDLFPQIPFRIDFLALTTISTILAYQTVRGAVSGEIDVTRNSLIVAGSVEISLIIGDIVFLYEVGATYYAAIPTRASFVVLTAINFMLVCWIYHRLHMKKIIPSVCKDFFSTIVLPIVLLFGLKGKKINSHTTDDTSQQCDEASQTMESVENVVEVASQAIVDAEQAVSDAKRATAESERAVDESEYAVDMAIQAVSEAEIALGEAKSVVDERCGSSDGQSVTYEIVEA